MLRALLLLTLWTYSHAADITLDQAIAAIEEVETGSRHPYTHRVLDGRSGEVSCWQISPAVCHDLRISRSRCRKDPVYAEGAVRKWLNHLLHTCGTWDRAFRVYHRGRGGMGSAEAADYAQRCLNLIGAMR